MALLKVSQVIERNPGLSEGGVRWDLFHRDQNGLAATGAVIRRGRHLLLDEDRYLAWMRTAGQTWRAVAAGRRADREG